MRKLRKLILVFSLFVALSLICGCTPKDVNEPKEYRTENEPEISESIPPAETSEPQAVEETDNHPEDEAYQIVLNDLRGLLEGIWNNQEDHPDWLQEFQDADYSWVYYYYPNDCGYIIQDIDGDGVHELLIGRSYDDGERHIEVGNIYDMFSYRNGELIHVCSSGERDRYSLCEDGTIKRMASGSAFDTRQAFYSYQDGELTFIEAAVFDQRFADDNGFESAWFHSLDASMDLSKASNISQEQADTIIESHTQKDINYQLL